MRYYRKMFLAFAGTAVLYTLLMEMIFLVDYRIAETDKFNRNLEATLQQMADYTDFRLQSVQETYMLLRTSEYTGKYLQENVSEPDNYTRFKLFSFINSIFGIAPAQKQAIAVTKITDDYVMMNSSTGNLDFFKSNFHISEEMLQNIVNEKKDRFLRVTDNTGRPMVIMIGYEWLGRPQPLYVFTSFYENQLFYTMAVEKGTFLMLYQNEVVASIGKLPAEEALEISQELPDSGYAYRTAASSLSGVRYIYMTEPPGILTPTFLSILAAGLLAMAGGIALMHLITKRMYTPIEGLLQTTGTAIASGDEFAHIRETFTTLHTDVEEMSRSLEKYNASLENKFLQDLLLGLIPENQISENLRKYHYLKLAEPLMAVILKYTETAELETGYSHSMTHEIKQKLNLTLETIFQSKSYFKIVDMNFETQALIINEGNPELLSELLRNSLLAVEPEYGLEINAFIGPVCNHFDMIVYSYRQALKIAEMSRYSPLNAKVVSARDMKASWKDTVYYPLSTEQSLINAIIQNKTSVWQSVIDEIINTNQNDRPGNLAQLPLMLTATVNRIIDGLNKQPAELFGEDTVIYLEFRSCHTYEDLHQKALSLFSTLASCSEKKQELSTGGIADRMLEYLHNNYNRDISLFDLADYLNMSRNYVSTLFKNATGRNFKDYLSKYRCSVACEIIKEHPGKKIKDVAELVGCNTDILSRMFLRYSGMTPSEYQRQFEKQNGIMN